MTRLTWNKPDNRYFETGCDRGVFYPRSTPPVGPTITNRITQPRPTTFASAVGWSNIAADGSFSTTSPYSANMLSTSGAVHTVLLKLRNTDLTNTFTVIGGGSPTDAGGLFSALTPSPARPTFTLAPGETKIVRHIVTLPAGSFGLRVLLSVTGGNSALAVGKIMVDEVLLVDGTYDDAHFDGATTDVPKYTYDWTGTAFASTSTRLETLSNAVVWDGLTSVEEGGAESAVEYYIDGQPFLYFPKAKDYMATLRAYTYPDEFAEVMGLVEIEDVDGLYADSQVGDSFGLTYRTMVGNAVDGVEHGYKIHLVYNAVVTPQSVAYDTLSSSINPNEFSWDIKAVPVAVEGYRPTAHFVIDTRKMSAADVARLEDTLYGSPTTPASLPDIIDVIELIMYDGGIIIVDNGDGTWTAKGSHHRLYLLDADTFKIEDVETTDYGDGTFLVSSTP